MALLVCQNSSMSAACSHNLGGPVYTLKLVSLIQRNIATALGCWGDVTLISQGIWLVTEELDDFDCL
jgi:hypothetical protein